MGKPYSMDLRERERARYIASPRQKIHKNEGLCLLEERVCRLVHQRIEIGFAALEGLARICAGTNGERDALGGAINFAAHKRLVT